LSKIALSGNASGTGTFTLASPNSNTDRTLNLPDSAGTLATAESTLTQFNASGSAPVYACRAWVNFDGTGTVAIRASGNVSSITDNGTGDYTVNFTTAMPDANYSISVSCSPNFASNMGIVNINASNPALAEVAPTTSAFQISLRQSGASQIDGKYINLAIFR
jgi:hypothetical protein